MKSLTITLPLLFLAIISCQNPSNQRKETTAEAKRYVRKNAHSPEAEKDLEAMNKALEMMRNKDCNNPLSWYYQGAIHWVPDTIVNNPLCASYHYSATDLKTGWDNCTHTDPSEIHFLIWHRLYIYHFEKIVRKLSGYEDFALPYWGYTDTVDAEKNRRLPVALSDPNSKLFEKSRFDSLNAGYPVDGHTLRTLDLSNLFECRTFAHFNGTIDKAPHGAMHDYIGAGNDTSSVPRYWNPVSQSIRESGLMGWVPTAAFDPVFWLHHANIDRIWQQWTNSEQGQAPFIAMLNNINWPYVFFDEEGNRVEYKIEDVLKLIYNMDYDYDDTKMGPPQERKKLLTGSMKQDTVLVHNKPVILKNSRTDFQIPNTIKDAEQISLINVDQGSDVLIMTVEVSFVHRPKGNYEIYLNLPKGAEATPKSSTFCGFMTFFGADHKHGGHAGHHHGTSRTHKKFSFEITADALVSDALNKPRFDLTVLRFDGSTGEEITIENVVFKTQR